MKDVNGTTTEQHIACYFRQPFPEPIPAIPPIRRRPTKWWWGEMGRKNVRAHAHCKLYWMNIPRNTASFVTRSEMYINHTRNITFFGYMHVRACATEGLLLGEGVRFLPISISSRVRFIPNVIFYRRFDNNNCKR